MLCSKEEIEKKRLSALHKRQNKISNTSPSPHNKFNNKTCPLRENLQKNLPYLTPRSDQTNQNVPVTKVVTGNVYLISEDRFEVNPSEFCAPLVNIFKTIPSRIYVDKTKLWNFSIEDYNQLMCKVAPLAPHVVLGAIPPYVLKILKEQTVDPKNIDLMPIESTIRQKLLPFQEDGVRFGIARHGRCMIADDMGLGKTYQALAIASYYRHEWPLLIVTTSSMRETWQRTIHDLLPSVPMMNIAVLSSGKDVNTIADKQTEVVIVSYKMTSMHTELLQNKNFGVVIIDESHHLKSGRARCVAALGRVAGRRARALLLSGTPALSRPAELYAQLALIRRDLFPSYTEFGKRYCNGKQTSFGWDMSGQSNLAELQVLLQKFLIRRTKEQVLTNLEEKIRESVLLDSTLLRYSAEDEAGLSQLADTYRSTSKAEKHAALINFFSESARVKLPAICKYIKQLLADEATGKFLVFAHHKIVIEAICATLDEAAVNYICIAGSTPAHSRADLVDRFQHSASCRAGVLSITAASAGITLTAADLVLFAELHWNPGILTQAESRAHRLGRAGAVRVRYLLAARTADDYMWPLLQSKLNVLNDVGLSEDTFETTTMKHQESNNRITQYLTPPKRPKNKNDYIPGTNLRKNPLKCLSNTSGNTEQVTSNVTLADEMDWDSDIDINKALADELDKSFFDDQDGDEMLANIDI